MNFANKFENVRSTRKKKQSLHEIWKFKMKMAVEFMKVCKIAKFYG